jgi:hypothetical protein
MDISKTGLRALQADFTAGLAQRHRNRLHIIVDACQGRISQTELRKNIAGGHIVALTGSKFYTGPPFSGVTFVPHARYASPPAVAEPATLVRWAAALGEMRAFAEVPPRDRAAILQRFGDRTRQRIHQNPRLVPFAAPSLGRADSESWDAQQTIFVFGVRNPAAPDRLLGFDALTQIHRWLYSDLGDHLPDDVAGRLCRLGQPVRLGDDTAHAVAALRIASGARVVSGDTTTIPFHRHEHVDTEVADMNAVMSKLAAILDNLPRLQRERS